MKSIEIYFGIMTPYRLRFYSGHYIADPIDIDTLISLGIAAEKLGFNSIHLGDHAFIPIEPITALTALAVKTERLRLIPNILDMNRRNPATAAHALATLDHFSGGRLILGAGCGMWNWPTYNVPNIVGDTGRSAGRKVSRAKEAIEALKAFWTEPEVNYKGEFFNFENARIETKPLQKPHPPIWIAAYGWRMKRIAGELGDGFITQTVPPSMFAEEVEAVKGFAREAGRDPEKIKPVLATMTGIARTHDEAVKEIQESARNLLFRSVRDHADHHNRLAERLGYDELLPWDKPEDVTADDICQVYLIGTPEEIVARIEEYMKSGAGYIIAMGLRTMESLELFSEKVIKCFKE